MATYSKSKFSKIEWSFTLICFVCTFIYVMIVPFAPRYLSEIYNVSDVEITRHFGLIYFLGTASTVVLGILIDKYDIYKILLVSSLVFVFFPVTVVLDLNYHFILLTIFLVFSAKNAIYLSIVYFIFKSYEQHESNFFNSIIYAVSNLAMFFTPMLHVFIGSDLFYVVSIVTILTLLLCFLIVKGFSDRSTFPSGKSTATTVDQNERIHMALPKGVVTIIGIGLCYSLIYNNLYVTIPLNTPDAKIFDFSVYPILLSINGLLVFFLQFLYIKLNRVYDQSTVLGIGVLLLFACFPFLFYQKSAIYLISFILVFTVAEALIEPAKTALLNRFSTKRSRGFNNALSIGTGCVSGLGIYVSGLIINSYGFDGGVVFWMLISLMMSILALFCINLVNQERRVNYET
ncbi:MFS transporter [Exilibacterium tricleocarpae]|uniref:MFS transporter n=1 Tax=Exilibacterium tricleocarpae TaxID=2591008 RepID=A0A545SRQ4_9GAMM|nr:MFS transporter [Exilibacterium tricleocarpae]TQV67661.1 MFS transporter [Exilibacterium tricleocarpae]